MSKFCRLLKESELKASRCFCLAKILRNTRQPQGKKGFCQKITSIPPCINTNAVWPWRRINALQFLFDYQLKLGAVPKGLSLNAQKEMLHPSEALFVCVRVWGGVRERALIYISLVLSAQRTQQQFSNCTIWNLPEPAHKFPPFLSHPSSPRQYVKRDCAFLSRFSRPRDQNCLAIWFCIIKGGKP